MNSSVASVTVTTTPRRSNKALIVAAERVILKHGFYFANVATTEAKEQETTLDWILRSPKALGLLK